MRTRIPVIADFVSGRGLFRGDQQAWEISQKMSRNQRRRFERDGIVPRDFLEYLSTIGVIRKGDIPKERLTVGNFLDFIRLYHYESEQARSYGEALFRRIIGGEIPWLRDSFGQSDFLWAKAQQARNLRRKKEGSRPMIK